MADESSATARVDLRAVLMVEQKMHGHTRAELQTATAQAFAAVDEVARLNACLADRDKAHTEIVARMQADIDRLAAPTQPQASEPQ